ncbi:MAG: helix-turn-helix domain-containing protein [Deltaproteobacteria bacterium]|nr:helix-turn-helix domain-containing protein [Deltaproteobacteria bacterium]
MLDTFISDEPGTAGQRLKNARMAAGVKLEDAARTTRIAKGYLIALEEDAYQKLPSETYARGFLRVYANFLGLQGEEILSLYRQNTSAAVPEEFSPANPCTKETAEKRALPNRLLWPLAAFCLVIAGGFFLVGDREKGLDTGSMSAPPTPSEKVADVPVVQQSLSSGKRAEDPQQNLPLVAEIPANQSKVPVQGIILTMKALEDGSLDIVIDDAASQHYDLKAGDLIEWKADKVFSLNLENSGGVDAELNGKPLKPFGAKGAPARVVLSAGYDGIKTEP